MATPRRETLGGENYLFYEHNVRYVITKEHVLPKNGKYTSPWSNEIYLAVMNAKEFIKNGKEPSSGRWVQEWKSFRKKIEQKYYKNIFNFAIAWPDRKAKEEGHFPKILTQLDEVMKVELANNQISNHPYVVKVLFRVKKNKQQLFMSTRSLDEQKELFNAFQHLTTAGSLGRDSGVGDSRGTLLDTTCSRESTSRRDARVERWVSQSSSLGRNVEGRPSRPNTLNWQVQEQAMDRNIVTQSSEDVPNTEMVQRPSSTLLQARDYSISPSQEHVTTPEPTLNPNVSPDIVVHHQWDEQTRSGDENSWVTGNQSEASRRPSMRSGTQEPWDDRSRTGDENSWYASSGITSWRSEPHSLNVLQDGVRSQRYKGFRLEEYIRRAVNEQRASERDRNLATAEMQRAKSMLHIQLGNSELDIPVGISAEQYSQLVSSVAQFETAKAQVEGAKVELEREKFAKLNNVVDFNEQY